MSTTDIGNDFRDQVCALLRTKYSDAEVEKRICGTKVDIVFTAAGDVGSRKTFAVECKNYSSPLTKTQLTDIRSCYQPMQDDRRVDEVLIVSRKPLNADANAFMDSWRNAAHHTFDELSERLLGIGRYIEQLALMRPTDETHYVEARIAEKEGIALDLVDEWSCQGAGRGLAIRGSYGQGKTSFANRLAARCAERHLADPAQRIPILHRLGTVVHETRLEALFGAKFTADDLATDFRFGTFEYLNRKGRLLVILDGFDEMKHAMTGADFLANFEQFNRLLVGDAKVVLLGRPNALPTDTEELVFRGKKTVASQEIASSIYQPWLEWRLAYFTPDETRELLSASLTEFVARHTANRNFTYGENFVPHRLEEILFKVPEDLLKRPVHVNIVAELGADPNFNFEGFNEFMLYDHFIREMVARDVKKKARQAIAVEDRLKFQLELAWWAWSRPGTVQGFFLRREIPKTLILGLPDGNAAEQEGKLNEYIVSSLTEEKQAGTLFFGHRSFQEFLVAERARQTVPTPANLRDYSTFLTDDVLGYLRQAPNSDFIFAWYETLRGSAGPFSRRFLGFIAQHSKLVASIRAEGSVKDIARLDPWTVCILALSHSENVEHAMDVKEFMRFAAEVVKKGQSGAAAAATLGMIMVYTSLLEAPFITDIMAALVERCLRRARRGVKGEVGRDSLTFNRGDTDFASTWLSSCVDKKFSQQGEIKPATLEFNLVMLEEHCANQLAVDVRGKSDAREHPLGPFLHVGTIAPVSSEAQKVYNLIDKDLRDAHLKYLQARRPNFSVVEVGYVRRHDGDGLPKAQHASAKNS